MYLRTFVSVFCFLVALCSSSTAADSRIVNGVIAGDGQYPYQVSLRTLSNSHFCGGSILNIFYVLTAAHCLEGSSAFMVVVGTNTLSSGGVSHTVLTRTLHFFYNPYKVIYDAGVVKTTNPITFSSKVQPIDIALFLPFPGSSAVVTGWGLTSYPSNTLPDKLQTLTTTFIGRFNCLLRIASQGDFLDLSQICSLKQQAGFCLGDSGGPLVVNNFQIGIVSLAYPCAIGLPDIYTNVPLLSIWIKLNTRF